jgi:Flp pilus assembly protein TadB
MIHWLVVAGAAATAYLVASEAERKEHQRAREIEREEMQNQLALESARQQAHRRMQDALREEARQRRARRAAANRILLQPALGLDPGQCEAIRRALARLDARIEDHEQDDDD